MIRAVVLLVLVLSACTVQGQPVPGSGPVTARVDVQFRPVQEAVPGGAAAPPDVLVDGDGVAYRLAAGIGDFTRFDDVRAEMDPRGTWVVTIDLTAGDAAVFERWTAENTGSQLAIVVDGEVVTAPVIQSAITGGSVQIAGNYTREEAEELAEAITGG
jgi:preprotein translocase subunit SecD